MRIIYPQNPFSAREPDEPYQEEFLKLKALGIDCSLFDLDSLDLDIFRPKPQINAGEIVLYRGWMLSPEKYQLLCQKIIDKGANPLTSYKNYLKCHHLPSWYDQCSEFTAKTAFFPYDTNIESNIRSLGWKGYFIKDYVKSNSTEVGSIAKSPEEALNIIKLIETYRGGIEGGISVRQVENYIDGTEQRYFIFNGKAFSPSHEIPQVVNDIASKIDAPFYSVDIVQREDGLLRLVELGDGQVSDKKAWDIDKFISIFVK